MRELRNFADRLLLGVLLQEQNDVPPLSAFADHLTTDQPTSLTEQMDLFERHLIAEALRQCDANVALAADHLAVPKKTLYDKIKKYHLGASRG